jgi:large subunit ribosomal protein L28
LPGVPFVSAATIGAPAEAVKRADRRLDARRGLPLYRPLFARGLAPISEYLEESDQSVMSRRCELTGVGPMTGHRVSHSNIKSKRRFLPALSPASVHSEALNQTFRLRISNAALRTLDFRGGLDPFLMKASDEVLSPRAQKIKRQVKAKTAAG